MNSALLEIEAQRTAIAAKTERDHKATHGQFMTPATVASFMAGLMQVNQPTVRILEPGAGIGSLTSALLAHREAVCQEARIACETSVTAIESDEELLRHLRQNLKARNNLSISIEAGDFIEFAVNQLQFGNDRFSHAILNPPYKKIGTDSAYRKLGRLVGIETVNLYSLFVALSIKLLAPGGSLVAIVPRSFCNGPYYRPFRDLLFENCAIEQIHLFHSRNSVFSNDGVLQENIILHVTRGAPQREVIVSTSTDDSFDDLEKRKFQFTDIVKPHDQERFIHIPTGSNDNLGSSLVSLNELNLKVSTGPVVDFRLREFLSDEPAEESVPLLYPGHFKSGELNWPIVGFRKPNAIERNPVTQKWLLPSGHYVITRRFSSKEEKRRVVAHLLRKDDLEGHQWIGLENHFNVFHSGKKGMNIAVARGLVAYLNSKFFDDAFRQFSGHTQVNATDLRNMSYLPERTLRALGRWVGAKERTGVETDAWINKQL